MQRLIAASGLGPKEPAAFVVETGPQRLLLDFGTGPGCAPDRLAQAIGRVDAIILSHQHADHAGALGAIGELGNPPVYATAIVHQSVAGSFERREIPLNGESNILGIPAVTGRNGHAPGGVWLHLGIGDGLLYMGDNMVDPPLFAADPPPASGTIIIDASYGDAVVSMDRAEAELAMHLSDRPAQLPVPVEGRSGQDCPVCASDRS